MTDKKREERLRRARARLAKLEEATKASRRAGRMRDWRPKAVIWLHPDTDIVDRRRVWFSKEVDQREEDEKGKKGKKSGRKKVVSVPFVVPEDPKCDPFYLLREALTAAEDIDGDEVVLSVGSGRLKVEYRKGDVLGWDDFSFKKRLKPQSDFVCAAILAEDSKGKRPGTLKCEIFSGAKSLGNDIRREIQVEIDENGEEEGNPFFNPYPFLITYDETASGTDMYSANARPKRKSDDEMEKIFDADAPSLEDEITPDDSEAVYQMLKAALVVDLDIPKPKAVGSTKEDDGDQVEDAPAKDEPEDGTEDAPEDAPEDEPDPEPDPPKRTRRTKKEPAKKEPAKKEPAKATERKPRKKAAAEPAPEPADEVEVPEGYEDPGSALDFEMKNGRKDVSQIGWWPDREKGEVYDICPKCDRPVREDDQQCPHKDCGVSYAPADGGF